MAGVDHQHLDALDLIEHGAQHIGGHSGLLFAVGEQQRHAAGAHAVLPHAMGTDIEIADVVRVRLGKSVQHHARQISGGGEALGLEHQRFQGQGAAGERFCHPVHIVEGGGGSLRLAEKAVAADQQRPVDAAFRRILSRRCKLLRPGNQGQEQPQRQQNTQHTTHGFPSLPG